MEHSFFMKHFQTIFKLSTFVDIRKKKHFTPILSCRIMTVLIFLSTTISCTVQSKNPLETSRDVLLFILVVPMEIYFISKLQLASKLTDFVLEPIVGLEESSDRFKAASRFNVKVYTSFKKWSTVYFMGLGSWWIANIVIIIFPLNGESQECIHLSLGWIWHSLSYSPIIILNFAWVPLSISTHFIWFFLFFYGILKTKLKIRQLITDLDSIQAAFDKPVNNCEVRSPNKVLQTMGGHFQMPVHHVSIVDSSHKNEVSTTNGNDKSIEAMILLHHQRLRENIINQQVKLFLKNVVNQHVKIIGYVNLLDKMYGLYFMILLNVGVVVVALSTTCIPKPSLMTKDIFKQDDLYQKSETKTMMIDTMIITMILGVLLSIFSSFGQILHDESENLRQALFNCDWIDKPYSLRRGLLIMQIVATRRLQVTYFGMLPVCLKVVVEILSSIYSYASLIYRL